MLSQGIKPYTPEGGERRVYFCYAPSNEKTYIYFSPGCPSTIDQSKVDPVIKVIAAVLHLADVENKALPTSLGHLMSPQVGGTVVWFLRHFSKSYLLPDEREYEQLSVTLSSVFGQDTNGGKWTIGFLLEKVRSNLSHWSCEPALAEDTVLLLLSLVDTKQR